MLCLENNVKMNAYCFCDQTYRFEQVGFYDSEMAELLKNMTDLPKWGFVNYGGRATIFIMGILMTIGIPLNVMILCVSVYVRKNSTTSSFLVTNMAVNDILILMNGWIKMKQELELYNFKWIGDGFLGQFVCKMYFGTTQICMISTLLIVSIIAFDRLYMIKRSVISRNARSNKYMIYTIVVWVVAVMMSLPIIVHLDVVEKDSSDFDCRVTWNEMSRDECKLLIEKENEKSGSGAYDCENEEEFQNMCKVHYSTEEKVYWAAIILLCIVFPIILTLISYLGIVKEIEDVQHIMLNIGSSTAKDPKQKFDGVKVTLSLSCGAIAICWGPLIFWHLMRLVDIAIGNSQFCKLFFSYVSVLPFFLSVFNAVLYSFVGSRFRKDLAVFFNRIKRREKHISSVRSGISSSATEKTLLSRRCEFSTVEADNCVVSTKP